MFIRNLKIKSKLKNQRKKDKIVKKGKNKQNTQKKEGFLTRPKRAKRSTTTPHIRGPARVIKAKLR